MHVLRTLALLLAALLAPSVLAAPLAPDEVPDTLRTWVPWVLQDVSDAGCPTLPDAQSRRCVWPGRLRLVLDERGADFALGVDVFRDAWVVLPGAATLWPQDVTRNGVPALVSAQDGRPALRLPAGRWQIGGRFDWAQPPESVPVPPDYGLVDLVVAGRSVAQPALDPEGRLWLRQPGAEAASATAGSTLALRVFRRVVDEIPLEVETRVELDVAGAQREVRLAGALLPGFIPMALTGPLPARLEADGTLRLQVRPGTWALELTARHPAPVDALVRTPPVAPWPAEEIWVFDARPALRLVEVGGAAGIDPRQTRLPAEWQSLPAYRLTPADTLRFETRRRGDPEPEPDALTLARELWLDFDGAGYTVSDAVRGRMTAGWRLEVQPRLALGRVALAGQPQFITSLTPDGPRGVEVRRGTVDLSADARLEGAVRTLPATGWQHDFQQVHARLHLPPGWRLLGASGVDRVAQSWLAQWSLLDLFLAIIAALAMGRLFGPGWGVLAAVTLALTWQERDAARTLWLHALAAIALLRVLPAGRIRRWVSWYRAGALFVLVAVVVPFAVAQVRIGLFPQLDETRVPTPQALAVAATAPAPATVPDVAEGMAGTAEGKAGAPEVQDDAALLRKSAEPAPYTPYSSLGSSGNVSSALDEYDPGARIQTGPGLPTWGWTTVELGWSGPVAAAQTLNLVLLSPTGTLVLNLVGVTLLALLALRLLATLQGDGKPGRGATGPTVSAAPAVLTALTLLCALAPQASADIPDAATLETLRGKLLAPPDCAPDCAQIPRMQLALRGNEVILQLEVHALAAVAVPLPAAAGQWLPQEVLLDGEPAVGLTRVPGGELRLVLEPGLHRLLLTGAAPRRESFQLPLPLPPRRVVTDTPGWSVSGLRENGAPEPQLILTRAAADKAATGTLEPGTLPGFARVERVLHLGLTSSVTTRITRLTPPDSALALELPLLEGESVTTADVPVRDGRAAVTLAAGTGEMQFDSVLAEHDRIVLRAPATTDWIETWRADISPLWHATLTGLAVVHHEDGAGQWLPTWQPWPGEEVAIALTRPLGVPGQTLTVDASRLEVAPGSRATDSTLSVTVRSSQGGQHVLTLPPEATLQSVSIDDVSQPVRQDGRSVTLPLHPGSQRATLTWREPRGIGSRFVTPAVDLRTPSVNATVAVTLPQGRWTLLVGGPTLGPAVLFWCVLAVLVPIAILLGRLPYTPLRAGAWFLLGVGLTQTPVVNAMVVALWLFALGLRARLAADTGRTTFNLIQSGLVLLSVAALAMLYSAIEFGLLGAPSMQIGGNGSSAESLVWYQDRIAGALPSAWVVSVPIIVYRALMLIWSLWLAFALLGWMRWGWLCFSTHGLWRPFHLFRRRSDDAPAAPGG